MRNHGYIIALIMGTTTLAACGGGGGSVTRAGNSGADQVLASSGTAAEVLADGTTLRSSERTSSGIARNFDAETAVALPVAEATARVSRNDSGGLTLEVPGQEAIVFTAADLSEDGFGYENSTAGIWAWNGDSMADQLDPANGRNSLAFDYYVDEPSTGKQGFIVVGTETSASDLAALPTATYDGYARVRVAPNSDFTNYADVVAEAQGDVTLAANFGAGTVSGSVINMEGRAPRNEDPTRTWVPIAGELTLAETGISGNGFTGAVTANSAFASEIGTVDAGSSYSGTFFGPAADEVGGGISLNGTSAEDGAAYMGWGFFQAGKN